MKRTFFALAIAAMLWAGPAFGSTIATFADPSNGSTPLFTVNMSSKTITGGWSDSLTGLNLFFDITGNTYKNAYFTMTALTYTGSTTGAGSICFYADGAPLASTPLLQIDFQSAQIAVGGLSGDDVFTMNGITMSSSELAGQSFTDEVFSCSFANLKKLATTSGYTATASFTSSATVLPEPVTVAMLGLGMGILALRKRV